MANNATASAGVFIWQRILRTIFPCFWREFKTSPNDIRRQHTTRFLAHTCTWHWSVLPNGKSREKAKSYVRHRHISRTAGAVTPLSIAWSNTGSPGVGSPPPTPRVNHWRYAFCGLETEGDTNEPGHNFSKQFKFNFSSACGNLWGKYSYIGHWLWYIHKSY